MNKTEWLTADDSLIIKGDKSKLNILGNLFTTKDGGRNVIRNNDIELFNPILLGTNIKKYNYMSGETFYILEIYFNSITITLVNQYNGNLLLVKEKIEKMLL